MSFSPPPPAIWVPIGNWIPGIWPVFVAAANGALRQGDVVTSWWRGPAENRDAGGEIESQHLLALALDVAGDLSLAGRLAGAGFTVVPDPQGTHVHAQAFKAGVLGQAGIFSALGLGEPL